MEHRPQGKPADAKNVFTVHPELDRILKEGARRGRAGVHAAVLRILSLVGEGYPDLTPGVIWARQRQLRDARPSGNGECSPPTAEDEATLRRGYENGSLEKHKAIEAILKRHPDWPRRHVWRLAKALGLTRSDGDQEGAAVRQPWTEREVERLLNHAGYDSVETIAAALGRTPDAIRCKLASLGKRSKVTDSYSRRWIADALHVGFRAVNRLLEQHQLEMRNPLISAAALQEFIAGHAARLGLQPDEAALSQNKKPKGRQTQERIAAMFSVPVEQVRQWVTRGWLQPLDERISARSFERYCRSHAADLNHAFMEEDEREWLALEAGVDHWERSADSPCAQSVRRHACKVRRCMGCQSRIRGNAYFRHIKVCAKLKKPPGSAALGSSHGPR